MHAPASDHLETIAIVTDATADVPGLERSRAGRVRWETLPERWHADHGIDLVDTGDPDRKLSDLVLSGLHPDPSEPAWDDFCATYASLRDTDRVFSIHSPASVSGAVVTAREAAGAYPNVRVIEADVTGIGLGLLAERARDLAREGACADDVEAWLRAHRAAVRMLVVPDRFEQGDTQKGLATRLLTGRPMLRSGAPGRGMDRSRRLRSRRATVAAIERYFLGSTEPDQELHVALGHGDAAGAIDPFLDLLERLRPQMEVVLIGRVGPRLLEQVGARCVAAAWFQGASSDG